LWNCDTTLFIQLTCWGVEAPMRHTVSWAGTVDEDDDEEPPEPQPAASSAAAATLAAAAGLNFTA
jgi:hypothetical protein